MSLVRDIHKHASKRRLVELITQFAGVTDALVVGEGVEVAEEAAALRDCGVDLMQGYYFGRPRVRSLDEWGQVNAVAPGARMPAVPT